MRLDPGHFSPLQGRLDRAFPRDDPAPQAIPWVVSEPLGLGAGEGMMKDMIHLFWLHSKDISAEDAGTEDFLTAGPGDIRAEVTICGVCCTDIRAMGPFESRPGRAEQRQ
jgi:hypothetical protein